MKKLILLLFFWVFFGTFLVLTILPYQFSRQKPIRPDTVKGDYDLSKTNGTFMGKIVSSSYVKDPQNTSILGLNTSNKRLEVDLTNQRIYAFEDDRKIYDFPVSTGKWYPTPTGEFTIWTKIRYTKMEGGNKTLNTYYYLPNVPFTMFFANEEIPSWRGFGIHGAYWHNNFGHPMSHGCVNMKIEDAGILYFWADPVLGDKKSIMATDDNPGTKVVIYGTTPKS